MPIFPTGINDLSRYRPSSVYQVVSRESYCKKILNTFNFTQESILNQSATIKQNFHATLHTAIPPGLFFLSPPPLPVTVGISYVTHIKPKLSAPWLDQS